MTSVGSLVDLSTYEPIHYFLAVLAIIVIYLLYKEVMRPKLIDIPLGDGKAISLAL